MQVRCICIYTSDGVTDLVTSRKFLEEEMEFSLTLGGHDGEALRVFPGIK